MNSRTKSVSRVNRREVLRAAGIATAAGLTGRGAALAAADTPPSGAHGSNPYTKIGVRSFINLTATYTINGGTLTLPEVKKAMEEASHFSVNLDELMEKAGARLAELLGSEAGMVTSGAAARSEERRVGKE